ncbi:Pr6Pr family membrane protein [Raoultibacter phocaeensis]|uniref:Pr6Pr family membrane protein n=1 Tax=Raoultibacter phocaeensis TaxID=2479841 RepID=UPI00111AB963|nr:Pr6Pr family membrane protein [Raoultibacter phocaeensis]
MCIKNRYLSCIWKTAIVLIGAWGVLLNLGFPEGPLSLHPLLYYTIQSNLFVIAYFAFAAAACAREIRFSGSRGTVNYSPAIKGAVSMGIVVTLLIYWFVLVGADFAMIPNGTAASNLTVHLIVPVMVVADWALFDEKGCIRVADPVRWLALPAYYLVFALVAAQLGAVYRAGARYPYFFIDADLIGWTGVVVNVVLVAAAFLVLGYLVFALDRALGRMPSSRRGPLGEAESLRL